MLGRERADGVGIAGAIRDQRRAWREVFEQLRRDGRVTRLTRREDKADRTPPGVDERVDFRRRPVPGPFHATIASKPPFFAAPC